MYHVDKHGIKKFTGLGKSEDCAKVVLLDKSMVKVDFSEKKKVMRKRVALIEKYATNAHPNVPKGVPTQDYDSLNYTEIKSLCSDKGLSSKGKKEV